MNCLRITLLAHLLILGTPLFAEEIQGRVVGRDGNPIAQADVFVLDAGDRSETKTDDDGKFSLKVAQLPGTFLFVRLDGYRFAGRMLDSSDSELEVPLTRINEPAEPMNGKDWVLGREERMKLFHDMLDPLMQQVLKLEDDREKLRPMELLAKVDPLRALEILETKPFKDAQMAMMPRARAMEGLASHDHEAALEIAESLDNPYFRAFSLIDITRRSTEMSEDQKRELLIRAAGDAKSIKEPATRVGLVGIVAALFFDAGQKEEAKKLLEQYRPDAEKLPVSAWAGFTRGSFAEQLATFDVEAALSLIGDRRESDGRSRHLGNAAHRLAAVNTSESERLLNMISRPEESRLIIHERDGYAIRVCYRMAPGDLPRAKKIAASCEEVNFQAYALGLMAQALGPDKREEATELLRQAYDLLEDGIRDPMKVKIHAFHVAGALLPAVEQVDATLVPEMFWRTISLRTPQIENEAYRNWVDQQTAQLASWLSRYDREVAGSILQHWHTKRRQPFTRQEYAVALTFCDPAEAAQYAMSLDEPEKLSDVRYHVAKNLLLEADERVTATHTLTGLWVADTYDH